MGGSGAWLGLTTGGRGGGYVYIYIVEKNSYIILSYSILYENMIEYTYNLSCKYISY